MISCTVFVKLMLVFFLSLYVHVQTVNGHGLLYQPPGRSSLWRFGFDAEINYNDNELFCGGFAHQWNTENDGACGLCGDPYDQLRENEAGGKYAKRIIAKTYTEGSNMEVNVEITANHKGWFEFRLCKNDNFDEKFTQECLDEHLLSEVNNPSETRFTVSPNNGIKTYNLQLPSDLTCSQCVLQWKYNTGNSWGTDDDGTSCLGCGKQEQFYGCSDIAIQGSGTYASSTARPTTAGPTTTLPRSVSSTAPETTTSTLLSTILKSTTTSMATTTPSAKTCMSVEPFASTSMDNWCNVQCFHDPPYCPESHCLCS